MNFDELIDLLRSGEYPDTIYDDLGSAYKSLADSGNAALSESKLRVAELEAEVQKLKAHNYELMMSSSEFAPEVSRVDDDDDEHYEGESESFDDLFKEGE